MYSIVVLNKSGQYWGETTVKRVLKWIAKNKITILVAKEDEEICGVEIRIKMPLVVQLMEFGGFKVRSDKVHYSPQGVFRRDGNYCQYWHYDEYGKRYKHYCEEHDRTIDHVVPKCDGGEDSYENCVTSCAWHNTKVKKNKSLKESGLKLIRKPFTPVRKKGEMVIYLDFNFNPEKVAHRYYKDYLEKTLRPA